MSAGNPYSNPFAMCARCQQHPKAPDPNEWSICEQCASEVSPFYRPASMTTEPNKGDIVERLIGVTDKYPGFRNLNTDAAAEIRALREQVAALTAERTAHFEDINAALTRAGVNLCEIETYGGAIDSITAQRDAMVEALKEISARPWKHDDNGKSVLSLVDIARTALARIKPGGGEQEQPEEREPNQNKPIGTCPKCHTPVYTDEGFCGVCRPY